MAKFSVESVKARYDAGERVFTSHEVMVLLTRISHLENAAQQGVQWTCSKGHVGKFVTDEKALRIVMRARSQAANASRSADIPPKE